MQQIGSSNSKENKIDNLNKTIRISVKTDILTQKFLKDTAQKTSTTYCNL